MGENVRSIISPCAMALLSLVAAGCTDDVTRTAIGPGGPAAFAFVTTTDFQTGSSSVISLDSTRSTTSNVAALHSDAVARYAGGLVYVVNRFGGDNIQILDPARGFATVRQFSVGNGSDPHDIAVVNATKAYVTRYSDTKLWIVNPSTGRPLGVIDLAGLSDADGVPEMDYMALVGNRLFVTIQRIDRNTNWGPTGVSYMAVVDVTTNALVDLDPGTPGTQALALQGTNPFSAIGVDPASGSLYVAVVGNWGVADGGVELVDPVALRSERFILTEASLSGDITDVVLVSADRGYVIFTDASFNTTLAAFNPQTGGTSLVYAPGGFVLQDVELSPAGELFLGDRTPTKPGIRIYDAATGIEKTTDPIDVGLPPFDITFGGK